MNTNHNEPQDQLDTDSASIRSQSQTGERFRNKRQRQRHNLKIGNWNISSLTNKEHELIEEAKKYRLDIIGLSSTTSRGSRILDFDGWKLFYSGSDSASRAMAGVGILKSTRLSEQVIELPH